MRFVVLGPFSVPLLPNSRTIDFGRAAKRVFAKAGPIAEDRHGIDIDTAIGLYVLGLSPSGSSRAYPYYIGQSRQQTLKQRVFQRTDKVEKYRQIMEDSGYVKAAPFVYLLPLLTASGRLARLGSNKGLIDRAEYELIGLGRKANADLWNIKHRVAMDSFQIDGVHNTSGLVSRDAHYLAEMFDL